jgi:shikimate kinase
VIVCLQVLKELAPYKSLVVATGGGAVTRPKNWSYMHNGIVAWLKGEPSLLARRVVAEGIEKRPLLFGEGVSGVWARACVIVGSCQAGWAALVQLQ